MADKDKTKVSHLKHKDYIDQYDEYNNKETHHFDIATKQWVKSEELYKNRAIECLKKADIQCDEILIEEIENSYYFIFMCWEYMYEEIDEYIEILKANKTQKQTPQM